MTAANQRIASLDFIRGVAILGILFMNIHFIMGLPLAAYGNPDFDGVASLADKWVFSFEYLFVNTKFLALFSMLFGAGLLIQGQRLDERGEDSCRWLRRRLWYLALFGALHAVFIWPGDILFTYAVCGLVLQSQRYREPRELLRRGFALLGVGLGLTGLIWLGLMLFGGHLPASFVQAMADSHRMPPELLQDDIALWTGRDYPVQVAAQLGIWVGGILLFMLPLFFFWWCGGLMLLGMALFKLGWFTRERVPREAWLLGALGLAAGAAGLLHYWATDFADAAAANSPLLPLSGALLGVFYLNALAAAAAKLPALSRCLQPAGRMAFSLYLLQSIAMVLLFRWLLPEWYGRLEELELFALVLIFGGLQAGIAHLWLRRHRQGPMEGLWRRLSFRRLHG